MVVDHAGRASEVCLSQQSGITIELLDIIGMALL
jgi:hypothetical protein